MSCLHSTQLELYNIIFNSRHLKNFDFENLTQKACRNGAWKARVPTIRGKVRKSHLGKWCSIQDRILSNKTQQFKFNEIEMYLKIGYVLPLHMLISICGRVTIDF